MTPQTLGSNVAYNLQRGDILLAEKTRGWKISNFFPFAIRLITGNEVTHVAIVESCDKDTITYRDANPGGVKQHTISNVKNEREGGIVLVNDTVIEKIARITPLNISNFDISGPYNYMGIWTLMKWHFLGQFYTIPRVKLDPNYGKKFICSQYVTYILLESGCTIEDLFPTVAHPSMVEPDNFTTSPFEIIDLEDLRAQTSIAEIVTPVIVALPEVIASREASNQ